MFFVRSWDYIFFPLAFVRCLKESFSYRFMFLRALLSPKNSNDYTDGFAAQCVLREVKGEDTQIENGTL